MLAAFVVAYIPIDFTSQVYGDGFSVQKIGYFLAYNVSSGTSPKASDFQFGWLNNLNIVFCALVGIFLILVCYLNFFQAKKTIMNRYGYIMCAAIICSLILANVFGQLAGQYREEDPTGYNFFPIFFVVTKSGIDKYLYQWNESGITMLAFTSLGILITLVMFPFWIVVGHRSGKINKDTGSIMLLKDEKSKMMLARDKVKDHHKED